MRELDFPLEWKLAALQLETRLREQTGQAPVRLTSQLVDCRYPGRPYVAGWRVGVTFSDGAVRGIDILASEFFPSIPVRTALVKPPLFMTWPHVESDGTLCLLPNMAECDPDDPCAVAENLLNRSVQLVEELIEGKIVEQVFREEFLTYWAYKSHDKGDNLFSLLAPKPPSRVVRVWRHKGLEVVGENEEALAQWVRRRFGAKEKTTTEVAAFIWLTSPFLPVEYPSTAAELRKRVAAAGDDAAAVLDQAAVGELDSLVVILGANGRYGPGLISVKASNPKFTVSRGHAPTNPISKGFRPGRTPKPVQLRRYFGTGPVIRSMVQRADAEWVHGRGRDVRTARLLGSKVVIVGCGSVGAPVACTLAQGGIGSIVLVDHDVMSWPNVGRHSLGATAVGQSKAKTLAERLQADFPHLRIEGRDCSLEYFMGGDVEHLETADLIIAATGSLERRMRAQPLACQTASNQHNPLRLDGSACLCWSRGGHSGRRRLLPVPLEPDWVAVLPGRGLAGWWRYQSRGAGLWCALQSLWSRGARQRDRDDQQ